MKASDLFIRCLEHEGVKYIFGIPGEENLDVMDSLVDSPIQFITVRHEQGAAFMADVYGRLTGKAGVCLATLGPGATNLITGVADANMDKAPLVAIAGQASTTRLHKESHQVLNLVGLFQPISKYSIQILAPEIIPEIVAKAFKVAEAEKPGCSFMDFPENIADMDVSDKAPLRVLRHTAPVPPEKKIRQAAKLINEASYPIIMAGNGIIRDQASDSLVTFAEKLNIPVATTFMAKGVIPFSHPLCLGSVGLQSKDYVSCGFDRADVIICIGFDMVEYHPYLWNKAKTAKVVHINELPAEVDEYYTVEVGMIGNLGAGMRQLAEQIAPKKQTFWKNLRDLIVAEMQQHAENRAFPIKPQKILWDLRQVLAPKDIVISDVGAHKMWVARMYRAETPNTCIISNGFAAMGIALPGAIAAKIVQPAQVVVAVTGDAGFMMNCQELETAMRLGTPIIVLIWHDNEYGLIKWKQEVQFGRSSHIGFGNPDFVQFAESFGAKGYRVERTEDLLPILKQAIDDKTVVVIDCPVDYSENMKLTEKLGHLVCPI
ncbi:acetolactate synthase [Candidatus Thiomargarita nelsonii]|uniref:Acetolactate synthase n=1 Tax=Candidatus Thiomargarita nelsonii TaxID=1003181 RepID=A0A0A6PJG8_9GAMM|nr:acetolactate synthase [Candidatus Thiomargarita nelsonii]